MELFAWANGTYSFGFTDAEVGPPRCGKREPKCQGLVRFSGTCAPLQILDIVNSRVGIDPALFPAAANRTVNVNSVFGGIERDGSGRSVASRACHSPLSSPFVPPVIIHRRASPSQLASYPQLSSRMSSALLLSPLSRDCLVGRCRITSAEAISLSYTLNNDERDSIEDKQGFAWEEQLNYMIGARTGSA